VKDNDLTVSGYTDGDIDTNRSGNPTFQSVVEARYSRRSTLFGGAAALTAAVFGLAACGDDDEEPGAAVTVTPGANATTTSGKVVTLTGTVSAGSGTATGSNWSQVSGPAVTMTDITATSAKFIAPSVSATTQLVFNFNASTQQGGTASGNTTITVEPARLDFAAVPKNLNDVVTLPAGYSMSILYRLGDPINASTPAYANNGSDTNFAGRAGDHHDALYWYGLAASGNTPDYNSSTRGMLVMNHENISQQYLHPAGPTGTGSGQSRPEAEALKEIEAHGVSQIEVVRGASGWTYVQNSPLNGRITPNTPVVFNGPVRGSALLRTRYSPTGVAGRGTINNCANGFTYWGTNLTCEENWAGYFRRAADDNTVRGGATAKEVVALNRVGVPAGANGSYGWASVVPADPANTTFARWNASASGADATADFRNEPNQYGWVVETDPYNPNATPRKRTALGRFGHEGCWPSNAVPGRRLAFYMGDDARGEYIYKFVSATPWVAADAQAADRLAMGDKYLDAGTLYVARFDANGSGVWLPLVFGQGPITPANPVYAFADQADVLTNPRLAGDALGATKMDRPEWTAVNPRNGEVYITLTNNSAAVRPITATDAANPRFYNDPKGSTAQLGNPNGHIVRLKEAGDNSEALTFTWDIYLFAAGSDLNATNINISGLDATNDMSSPDGLWFARPSAASGLVTPLLWIQTDDGAYTDVTNCMMLAAMPGVVGDGGARTITNTAADGTTRTQATFVGKAPGTTLRRFLVGPKECEITGVDSTPDGRTLFVNIQHPGEGGTAGTPSSSWPATQQGVPGLNRPRSATIVITKDDGGVIGL
jgi:uncharacterized protein